MEPTLARSGKPFADAAEAEADDDAFVAAVFASLGDANDAEATVTAVLAVLSEPEPK
jgi:hypothetical protein